MKAGLDTWVMLRLLLGQPVDQAARAVAFLDDLSCRGHQAVVSDLVVAEMYFALQHHYGVSKPGFVDRLVQGAYAHAACEMATFEKAAGKLKPVRVL